MFVDTDPVAVIPELGIYLTWMEIEWAGEFILWHESGCLVKID